MSYKDSVIPHSIFGYSVPYNEPEPDPLTQGTKQEIYGPVTVEKPEQEPLTELLNEHDTITVSRDAFADTIKQLLTQLPDMLASSAENMPVYARAAMPVVRMLLASEEMQATLSGDSIINFIWEALEQCQK